MDLKRALYITMTGYGPCSDFTLAEWLHARSLYRSNEEKAKAACGIKQVSPIK